MITTIILIVAFFIFVIFAFALGAAVGVHVTVDRVVGKERRLVEALARLEALRDEARELRRKNDPDDGYVRGEWHGYNESANIVKEALRDVPYRKS